MTSEFDLAASLFGSKRLEASNERRSASATSTVYGTAVSDSADGSVQVVLDNGSVSAAMPDGTEGDNVLTLATSPAVKEGDTVLITAVGGTSKQMTVTAVVASGDRNRDQAAKAEKAAADAGGWKTLIVETDEGVAVGKSSDGETFSGVHAVLGSDSMSIRDGDGNELASYGLDEVHLGKNSTKSVIDLCDGSGTLSQRNGGGIQLRGRTSTIDSFRAVGAEMYGHGLVLATAEGTEGDASKPFGAQLLMQAQAMSQSDTHYSSLAKIEMAAFGDEESVINLSAQHVMLGGNDVTVGGMPALSRKSLYSSATGSTSVSLSAAITNYNYILVCIKNAQGAHHWVAAKAAAGDCPFETHGVTDGTMWVVFGTLNLESTTVKITSQVNMPISGYAFGTGSSNIDCRIIAVDGCR